MKKYGGGVLYLGFIFKKNELCIHGLQFLPPHRAKFNYRAASLALSLSEMMTYAKIDALSNLNCRAPPERDLGGCNFNYK